MLSIETTAHTDLQAQTEKLKDMGTHITQLMREEKQTSEAIGHALSRAKEECARLGFPFIEFVRRYVRRGDGTAPSINSVRHYIAMSQPAVQRKIYDRHNKFRHDERRKAWGMNVLIDEGIIRKTEEGDYKLVTKAQTVINALTRDDDGYRLLKFAWDKATLEGRRRFLRDYPNIYRIRV